MSAAETMLSRLARVKQVGPDRWIASCPTPNHERGDRSRGLSVQSVDDRVLIFCHAGCGNDEIVEALGLTLLNLFDRPLKGRGPAGGYGPSQARIPARDLLELISEEISVIDIIVADVLERSAIDENAWSRLAKASARIHRARDYTRVCR